MFELIPQRAHRENIKQNSGKMNVAKRNSRRNLCIYFCGYLWRNFCWNRQKSLLKKTLEDSMDKFVQKFLEVYLREFLLESSGELMKKSLDDDQIPRNRWKIFVKNIRLYSWIPVSCTRNLRCTPLKEEISEFLKKYLNKILQKFLNLLIPIFF